MKLVKLNVRKGLVKAVIKSYSDLVVLQYIVEKEDNLTAYSRRKISVGKSQEIKTIKIGLEVEKIELTETSLDVTGKIVYSSDENVPLHKYHTLILRKGMGFVLRKNKLMNFQVNMLKKAVESSPKVFICVYEIGYALFYNMSDYRIHKRMELRKDVSGKRFSNDSRKDFLSRLSDLIKEEYKKKYTAFVIAGKALDNDELKKEYLKGLNIDYENVSYADTGLRELLSKDSINSALSKAKLSIQRNLMEEYLLAISRNDERYVYGSSKVKEVLNKKNAVQAITSKEYLLNNKEIIEKLDESGCNLVLFDENDDSLTQLSGFGGIIVKFTNT